MQKVELHCHTDGLVSTRMVDELRRRAHDFPISAEALSAFVPVRSWEHWTTEYEPRVAPGLAFPGILPVLEIHVEDLVRQEVVYAELMVSGLLDPGGDEGAALERFRTIRRVVEAAAAGRIRIELLAAIGRKARERIEPQAARILALARAGLIRGVALAGDESGCTVASLGRLFDRMRDAGLGIEIHAGEMAGPASVRDALEHGRPQRLGHAVAAFADPALLDLIGERGVHVEFCPTSNLRLGVVRSIHEHPLARARELGLSYSVNSDDPGPFACTLESEFALLELELGFTSADFEAIRAHA